MHKRAELIYYISRFGFYYILPLTAPVVTVTPSSVIPPASITPSDDECTITLGDYNVRLYWDYVSVRIILTRLPG